MEAMKRDISSKRNLTNSIDFNLVNSWQKLRRFEGQLLKARQFY